ncbi:MAG: VOC family protein [Pseudomonadota bacterium]
MKAIQFVASAQPEAALEFYRDTLGFSLLEDSPFALAFDAAGTMLWVQKVEDLDPYPFTAIGWQVDDIAAERDRLAARGVKFLDFPHFDQDERDIWTTPDGAKVCWFRDPDGNTLSLTQFPN